MAIRKIVTYPNPVLKTRALEVTNFNAELATLLDDMRETMYAGHGVGLAAPQIGVSLRVAVMDVSDEWSGNRRRTKAASSSSTGPDRHDNLTSHSDLPSAESPVIELINPVIVATEGSATGEEGCLSIPDYREKVTRATKITIHAVNRKGEPFEISGDGLFSVCAQHEIDHLDGILFIDRLSRLKREMFLRWYKKIGGFEAFV